MKANQCILFLFFLCCFPFFLKAQCPPSGNVTLFNQNEVDSFIINYPNCTNVSGLLAVINSSVNNLLGLANIVSVEGLCFIIGTNIKNLGGLENLNNVGGTLEVRNNDSLTTVIGLGNIDSIGGTLKIQNNNALVSLLGLNTITYVTQGVYIAENNSLTSLNGLEELDSIGSHLFIAENSELTDLDGLSNLKDVGSSINIHNNDILNSFTGLSNLNTIGLTLSIFSNDNLTNLSGLENIQSINSNLSISNNPQLNSITALQNLTSINGQLRIDNNDNLNSLIGLENISVSGITDLHLENSPNLSICNLQNICDYLSTPSNPATISGNAIGCNSREEVETACNALPVELIKFRAGIKNDAIEVSWETVTETNNKGFYLQRSKDGAVWNALTFIEGNGTTSEIHKYQFIDVRPFSGENYYRLKQVDFDSKIEYSKVVLVMYETKNETLSIYPNPASDFISIQIPDSVEGQNIFIRIQNLNGEVIVEKEVSYTEKLNVDISHFQGGVYFIQANNLLFNNFVKL